MNEERARVDQKVILAPKYSINAKNRNESIERNKAVCLFINWTFNASSLEIFKNEAIYYKISPPGGKRA